MWKNYEKILEFTQENISLKKFFRIKYFYHNISANIKKNLLHARCNQYDFKLFYVWEVLLLDIKYALS